MIYYCIGLRYPLYCVLCVWFIVVLHQIFSGLGTLYMIYCCFVFRNVSGLGTLCMIYCCFVFRNVSGLGTLCMIFCCIVFRFSSGLGTLLIEINMLCCNTTSSELDILCIMKRCCIVFSINFSTALSTLCLYPWYFLEDWSHEYLLLVTLLYICVH